MRVLFPSLTLECLEWTDVKKASAVPTDDIPINYSQSTSLSSVSRPLSSLLARLEKEGPFAFLSENNKYIWDRLTQGGITFDQLVANWSSFMQMFREKGTRTFLKMMDKYKKDEDAVTLPTRRTSDVGQSNVPNLFWKEVYFLKWTLQGEGVAHTSLLYY